MSSNHFDFTKAALTALPTPTKNAREYYDAMQPGLSVRVHPSGKKTLCHVFRLPNNRTPIRQKLGYYPDTAIAEARERVRDDAPLVRKGVDPRRSTLAVPEPPPTPVTLFDDLAALYIAKHVPKKKSGADDVYWINKELLPAWRGVPVGEIKRRQVAALLNTIAKRGTRASDVVRSLISRMFKLGISEGFDEIDSNPASGTEPAHANRPREQMPTTKEFKRLWALWGRWIADGRALLGWQFQLRVLTAQRGAEVLSMRWSTVAGDRWTKPFEIRKRRKNARKPNPYLIVLGPMALAILGKIREHNESEWTRKNTLYSGRADWRQGDGMSDYVFPSRTSQTRGASNFFSEEVIEMNNQLHPNELVKGVRERKPTDFEPHDLRRWTSTNAQSVCPPDWVERYLDHEIPGVGGVYNLYAYEAEKRYVACAIENKVREAIGLPAIELPPVDMPGLRR